MSDNASRGRAPETSGNTRRRRSKQPLRKRRRGLFWTGITLAVLTLVLGGAATWLGVQAVVIRDNLQSTTEMLPQLKKQLSDNDKAGAAATVDTLSQHTLAAKAAGTDPVWKVAGALPWVGPNFAAATTVTVTADDVVQLAAKPLLGAFESLDWKSLTPKEGAIELDAIRSAAPSVVTAANTVELSHNRLADIDQSRLVPQIAEPLASAQIQLNELRGTLNVAANTAQLLPAMMGSETPRNYLLLIQNSAEIRATGGISGALTVLSAKEGKIELAAQGSASELGAFVPALKVDAVQEAIYTNRLGSYMQNVNMTPDFPTAAATAQAMWQQRNPGDAIDGVITIDPSALALVLEATGPVDVGEAIPKGVSTGSLPTKLDSNNLVKALLSDVYANIEDPGLQDAYFAKVAETIFAKVSSGNTPGEKLVTSLGEAVADNRIKLWSANPEEQKLLSTQNIGGAISGPSVPAAAFGVYFNDGTGAKMDYYVKRTTQLIQHCPQDGYGQYTARITMVNTAPADAATSLPEYVTGGGSFGVEPGSVATNVVVYGPAQARTQAARLDGAVAPISSFIHAERPVGTTRVQLAPGQTATVEVDFSKVVQTGTAHLDVTPTIQKTNEVILPLEEAVNCGAPTSPVS